MDEQTYHDEFYTADADRILNSDLIRRMHERASAEFLMRGALNRRSRVLSLGCGEGAKERLLAPSVGAVVGWDVSPVAVEVARRRAANLGLNNLSFEVADLRDIDSLSVTDRYDGVCAFGFLHHLADVDVTAILGFAFEILRPGGVFFSMDPNAHRLVKHLAVLVKRQYDRYHSPDERELDPKVLASMLQRAGFIDVQVQAADFFIGPVGWLVPGLPRALATPFAWVDAGLSALPGLRRYSSSFSISAIRSEGS